LVTGGCGFIGSHLCEALIAKGYEVRAYDLYNSHGYTGWLEGSGIEVVLGDVRDFSATREAMKDCDAVMHLAALIAIPYSYTAPESYIDTNVKGTLNVLQAARDLGTNKIVCTSTSEVYGSAQYAPMDEKHPIVAQSPYAASKIAADQLALSFYRSFGTPVTIARPFNTYGLRQSPRAIIASILTQMPEKVKVGSLTPTRDFMHVSDTVAGMIACLEHGKPGEIYNFGTGDETSIARLLEVLGAEYEQEETRMRPTLSEVTRLCCDWSKASALGWEPKVSIQEGLGKLCSLGK
jgi:NAD dependent epimerase/dehydratase